MTPNTITIPAELVGLVRGSAYWELHGAIEDAHDPAAELERENPGSLEQFMVLMARMDAARALLDRLSWTTSSAQEAIEIDLHQYHPALQAALATQLDSDEGYLETTPEGAPGRAAAAGRMETVNRLLDEIGELAPGATGERQGEEHVLFVLLPGVDSRVAGEEDQWLRVAEIEGRLGDCEAAAVRYALDGLVAEGVAVRDRERVRASRCALHINAMGLI